MFTRISLSPVTYFLTHGIKSSGTIWCEQEISKYASHHIHRLDSARLCHMRLESDTAIIMLEIAEFDVRPIPALRGSDEYLHIGAFGGTEQEEMPV